MSTAPRLPTARDPIEDSDIEYGSTSAMTYWELRIYPSPTPTHFARLQDMLGTAGLEMFDRHGIAVRDAWTVSMGLPQPTLLYITEFADLAQRHEKWAAVDADTDWQRTKVEFAAGLGSLTTSIECWWLSEISPLRLEAGPGRQVLVAVSDDLQVPKAVSDCGVLRVLVGRCGPAVRINDVTESAALDCF